MLSMSKINNMKYYDDLASEDYYVKGGEPMGVWSGRGALNLGLTGHIETVDYKAIFSGFISFKKG